MEGEKVMHTDSVILREGLNSNITIHRALYFQIKRIFDVLIGLFGILMMLPIAFIIKIVYVLNKDYNSVFFKQERIGKNGRIFSMYKFRTMIPDADNMLKDLMENNPDFRKEYSINKKVKNDPRVTKIGKLLRKTSLDEVPQFINVLLGDMSLVGNRPYLPREKQDMGTYYKFIITTKPGITGLWQTSGRSKTTFQERLIIEKRYSMAHGLKTDIGIVFKTVLQVLKKEGAE